MEDNAAKYCVINGEVREADCLDIDWQTYAGAAYEVVRIIKRVPLFFEDHFERMKGTFDAVGERPEISPDRLKAWMGKLLEANSADNCNIKIVVRYGPKNREMLDMKVRDEENGHTCNSAPHGGSFAGGVDHNALGKGADGEISRAGHDTVLYISKSYYPPAEVVNEGVKTGILRIERKNPNAKLIDAAYKNAVSARIAEGGFFEVLLVDGLGRITEGSRSNVFFVKKEDVLTAPGHAVLKGITRKYVLEACAAAGCRVREEFVEAAEAGNMDGAFLSGTSINVLPIRSIDGSALNSPADPVVAAIRKEYGKILEKYIEYNVKIW